MSNLITVLNDCQIFPFKLSFILEIKFKICYLQRGQTCLSVSYISHVTVHFSPLQGQSHFQNNPKSTRDVEKYATNYCQAYIIEKYQDFFSVSACFHRKDCRLLKRFHLVDIYLWRNIKAAATKNRYSSDEKNNNKTYAMKNASARYRHKFYFISTLSLSSCITKTFIFLTK